jgi:DNA gyrase/topoisomerase IV subunit A
VIINAEENAASTSTFTTQADLMMPSSTQLLILTSSGLQRRNAAGYTYRVDEGLTSRVPSGGGHLCHIKVEPQETVIILSNRGRAWKGAVGYIPEEADPASFGLEKGETIVNAAVLQSGKFLVMVSRAGKVKRTKVDDLSLPDRTWDTVMGLSDDKDSLVFGAVAAEGAHIVFYTAEAQCLRIDGDSVNPQQTGSASGVAGIGIRDKDRLLGATLVPEGHKEEAQWQIIVASQTGFLHRFPFSGLPVKGRGSMGVRCLRTSKWTGKLADVAVAQEGDDIDLYLADGRRQRIPLKGIPVTGRDVQGERLVHDPKKEPIAQVVVLC